MSCAVYLGLGSNLGDRRAHLAAALVALGAGGFVEESRSSLYETEPVGGPAQGPFLNMVAGGHTALTPEDLLALALAVEQQRGRVRRERNGPRTLDIDLLLYGDTTRDDAQLQLPHPGLAERRFVLEPLGEIAPSVVHPRLGATIAELRERCPDRSAVVRVGAL
jgi:2-amino-4-hydroxy-6-hydroxymethyldihydropteridine diphosphokinase